MKYALLFPILGVLLIVLGLQNRSAGWLLTWLGVDLLVLGLAYGRFGAKVFGKRPDGKIAVWALLFWLPYLWLTWALWHLQRLVSREACCNEVAPGIWLGRRPFGHELPTEIRLLVDLTAEFPAVPDAVRGREYICLPILDTSVPEDRAFQELIRTIAAEQGSVYIHCAVGHGRSATVAAALLIEKGLAASVPEAESLLQRARPRVRLHAVQRALILRLAENQRLDKELSTRL